MSNETTATDRALHLLDQLHDWQSREGDTEATGLSLALEAIAHAVLSVTDQVRTIMDVMVQAAPAGLDPEAEDLDLEVEVAGLAVQLWEYDPGKNTPARTFAEDYRSNQDRYLVMARRALTQDPVEPTK